MSISQINDGEEGLSVRQKLNSAITEANKVANKVDKEAGKGLSDENYTLNEKQKLELIENEATTNETDAFLLARANHTGTQPSTTITYATTQQNRSGGFGLGNNIPVLFWTLTGNSTIVIASAPMLNNSVVINIIVNTQNGTETLSFPSSWSIYGTFDPTKENFLSVLLSNTGSLGVRVFINQPN